MRKQQLAWRAIALATALGIGSAHAGDGPTGAPSAGNGKAPTAAPRHDKSEHGKPDPGRPAFGKPNGPDANGKDAGGGERTEKGNGADPGTGGDARGPGRRGMHDLWRELKAGKVPKGELKERLSDMRAHREERAQDHRRELKARFGSALAAPAAREELEHHARRMAKLNRAMELAETEVTKDRDKLKDRIQKLLDKESARHQRAMDRFATNAPAAPSAALSAGPKSPPAAAAAEKGDKK